MDLIKRYLRARLKEPTTWRGLVLLLTSLGVSISPAQSDAIVAAGLAIAGAIGAFFPDQIIKDEPIENILRRGRS